ncbi:MAG: hypothetical protein DDT41_01679 [candidate division WS2 bacterium]|nr:hypothetical protein [Candidatus Psychracetigena formicireducens]
MKLEFNITNGGTRLNKIEKGKYNYININNNSQFDFFINNGADHSLIGMIPPFSLVSFPIDNQTELIETVWQSASIRWTQEQKCMVTFTDKSLGWGSVLNPPASIIHPTGNRISNYPRIYNILLLNSNTEYKLELGAITKLNCHIEEQNAPFRLAYLPAVAMANRPYVLVQAGREYNVTEIWDDISLYVAVDIAPRTLTVVVWG